MAKIDYDALPALRRDVLAALDGMPDFSWERREAYDRALAELVAALEKRGAVIDRRHDGTRVRLGGVNAHSTTGVVGALRNWHGGAGRALDKVSVLAR